MSKCGILAELFLFFSLSLCISFLFCLRAVYIDPSVYLYLSRFVNDSISHLVCEKERQEDREYSLERCGFNAI